MANAEEFKGYPDVQCICGNRFTNLAALQMHVQISGHGHRVSPLTQSQLGNGETAQELAEKIHEVFLSDSAHEEAVIIVSDLMTKWRKSFIATS